MKSWATAEYIHRTTGDVKLSAALEQEQASTVLEPAQTQKENVIDTLPMSLLV